MSTTAASVAYCGAPPDPAVLWSRWNLDPVLIAFLLLAVGLYAFGAARPLDQPGRGRQMCFYAGWTMVAAALVSPLCALSVSLFAARVGQHMVLALIAAPLVTFGLPRARSLPIGPFGAAMAFAAVLWFWHAPAPYAATFRSDAVYWAMHISTFGAAVWLWSTLLDHAPGQTMTTILAGLFSTVQMGFLGALITLAPHPLYAPHALTTIAWGFSPLQDQQLGGGIMWIPGCLAFLLVAMLRLGRLLVDVSLRPAQP
jgi:putative membrane protein